MTRNQKLFKRWIADFRQLCADFNGVEDITHKCDWHKFAFETEFGKLHATIHESDRDGIFKRSFAQIYLRFDRDFSTADAAKIDGDGWLIASILSKPENFDRMKTTKPIHEMSDKEHARWIVFSTRPWPEDDSKTVPYGGFAIREKTLQRAWQLQRQSRDVMPIY